MKYDQKTRAGIFILTPLLNLQTNQSQKKKRVYLRFLKISNLYINNKRKEKRARQSILYISPIRDITPNAENHRDFFIRPFCSRTTQELPRWHRYRQPLILGCVTYENRYKRRRRIAERKTSNSARIISEELKTDHSRPLFKLSQNTWIRKSSLCASSVQVCSPKRQKRIQAQTRLPNVPFLPHILRIKQACPPPSIVSRQNQRVDERTKTNTLLIAYVELLRRKQKIVAFLSHYIVIQEESPGTNQSQITRKEYCDIIQQIKMPTVTMTSELEHYVDSLRSFLDRNPTFQPSPASPKTNPRMELCRIDSGSGSGQGQDRRLTPDTAADQTEQYRSVQWKTLPSTQKNYGSLR